MRQFMRRAITGLGFFCLGLIIYSLLALIITQNLKWGSVALASTFAMLACFISQAQRM